MIFHIAEKEIDTEKIRMWVNSSRGRTLAFWLTAGAVVLLPLMAWFAFGGRTGRTVDDGTKVTLYTTADEPLVQAVVALFESKTGVKVNVVTDTEATRGSLQQRVSSEKPRPRADVWWSSEVVGTVQLAKEGVLAAYASPSEATVPGGWPQNLRPKDMRWYGFAERARVIAFRTSSIQKAQAPTKLRDLTRPQYKNKVGMANPRFGTTRSHLAFIVATSGEVEARAWLKAMVDNGVQIFPSNSAVVQAVSRGDVIIGLTDTDDVWAGKKQDWPVDLVYETPDKPKDKFTGLKSLGPLVLPNTVGRIVGSPNPTAGARLTDFLLSAEVEELLAQSDSHNVPIRADLAKKYPLYAVPASSPPAAVDYVDVARNEAIAQKIADDVLPK